MLCFWPNSSLAPPFCWYAGHTLLWYIIWYVSMDPTVLRSYGAEIKYSPSSYQNPSRSPRNRPRGARSSKLPTEGGLPVTGAVISQYKPKLFHVRSIFVCSINYNTITFNRMLFTFGPAYQRCQATSLYNCVCPSIRAIWQVSSLSAFRSTWHLSISVLPT